VLSTPSKKSIVDVQTLDTILVFTPEKKDIAEVKVTVKEPLPVTPSETKEFTSNKKSVVNQTDSTKESVFDQTNLTQDPSMRFKPILTNESEDSVEDQFTDPPVHEENTEDPY